MSVDTNKTMWPGWETVQLIGRGSFGAVYEIQRSVLGDIEKAALKVISIPQNDSDIEEMFGDGYDEESITSTFHAHLKSIVAEYSLMRKMKDSSNIVSCDDVRYVQHADGVGWNIYIKMELLIPLIKALPATVSEELVIKIAKDICAALELCSKHNIVHRDIKPQNIFVSENGDYKLGDFGIAKTVERTMGGTKIGTYKYMAPEVYNNKPYNTTADVYSLGLVLYWLLNERRMPFMPLPPAKLSAAMDEEARYRRFSGEKIPAPENGSKELQAIVLKACAFDPKDRYQSADEMTQALNALCGSKVENNGSHSQEDEDKIIGVCSANETEDALDNNRVEEKSVHAFTEEKKLQMKAVWYIVPAVIIAVLGIVLLVNQKCNHNWMKATCINPQFCEKCGDTIGTTMAHTWIEATSNTPKTCTVCGLTEGSVLTIGDNPAPTTVPADTAATNDTEPTDDSENTAETISKHADIEEKINNADLAQKPQSLYDEPITRYVTAKKGAVRRGCATDYRKLGTVRRGDAVQVYTDMRGEYGKWYLIQTENGLIGWINNSNIEKVG